MEEWAFDFEWLRIRQLIKDRLNKKTLPNLNAILFLIGIQELGQLRKNFSKEEKQDLMHIAVCRLLSHDGYYEYEGKDSDGWPHWKIVKPIPVQGIKEQEKLLKIKIIQYFKEYEEE